MTTITLEVPDELSPQLAKLGDRWQEWLRLSLQQPPLPARLYREILNFLAGNPTPQQVADLKPSPEAVERLKTLLERETAGEITPAEREELEEFERIEHLVVMIKAGALPYARSAD